jgi:hypothetical protein
MATRSRIAIENQDGTVTSIYCHFDGYLEGVGKTLFEHYDREKTEKLMELGDISVLGESTLDTIAYHRDRNEDLDFKTFPNVEDLFENGSRSGEEYIYCLAKNGIWLVNKYGSSTVDILVEELEEEGI